MQEQGRGRIIDRVRRGAFLLQRRRKVKKGGVEKGEGGGLMDGRQNECCDLAVVVQQMGGNGCTSSMQRLQIAIITVSLVDVFTVYPTATLVCISSAALSPLDQGSCLWLGNCSPSRSHPRPSLCFRPAPHLSARYTQQRKGRGRAMFTSHTLSFHLPQLLLIYYYCYPIEMI